MLNKNGYYYTEAEVGKYTYKINKQQPYITVAKYDMGGSYRVNTFQNNTFFKGKTTTTYVDQTGVTQNYTTNDIIYRFMIDDLKTGKASLLIYNAKFSSNEREPVKEAILAEGLDVEFQASGITITGENIIPLMLESGEYVPVPSFTFNSIKFTTTDDFYASGNLDYQVAGIYNGHFEGSYLYSKYINGENNN